MKIGHAFVAGMIAASLAGTASAQTAPPAPAPAPSATPAASAAAAPPAAAEAKTSRFSKASLMGELLENKETAAVFAKHLPGVPIADYKDMISAMSLEELSKNPQAAMIAEKLDVIDAALRAIK